MLNSGRLARGYRLRGRGGFALMWQWSGGGTFNGRGDFDQIDANLPP